MFFGIDYDFYQMNRVSLVIASFLGVATTAWGFGRQPAKPEVSTSALSEKIWITRPDGARSCGIHEGQSIDEGASELRKAGVRVLDSRKASDGKMHLMVCGAAEGSMNAFLISQEDLEKAVSLGFAKSQ